MPLVIAGERSGVGKTTVTLALLAYLSKQGESIQSFKVGPDYIDPMFHTAVTERPCRNLDPVLTSEAYVRSCFARHCQGVDLALVEGVMGLFDGIRRWSEDECLNDFASTAHVARLLDLPILLVIDSSRLSGSVAALAHGYLDFDPRIKIAGVVLNRVGSDRHLEMLQEALKPLPLPILGVVRRQDELTIPERHLGLVPTGEIDGLTEVFDRLAQLAKTFDWQSLLPLLKSNSPQPNTAAPITPSVQIAVACDRAFNFYYEDNLDLLKEHGAELMFWSPLEDDLPAGSQGLYLGGGFPEVFAEALSQNRQALDAVRSSIQAGMPTYAECGGLMYLCEQLVDFTDKSWSMVGILPTTTVMKPRLTLGYRRATALIDSVLLPAGETVWGHEFHRSQLTIHPHSPLFNVRGSAARDLPDEGWCLHSLHASYLHLHFGDARLFLQRFLQHCAHFSTRSCYE